MLVRRHLISRAVRRLLARNFRVTFIHYRLKMLVTRLLLRTVALTIGNILRLPATSFLIVRFYNMIVTSTGRMAARTNRCRQRSGSARGGLRRRAIYDHTWTIRRNMAALHYE